MKPKPLILTLITLTFAAATLQANPNDLDKDKRISWEEFATLKGKDAKKNGKEFNEKEIRYLFEDKDHDGNGSLSYKEFATHAVDLDGDKKISYKEFARMMQKRGERSGKVQKEEWIKNMFGRKDTDGNGSLSYQELAKPVK